MGPRGNGGVAAGKEPLALLREHHGRKRLGVLFLFVLFLFVFFCFFLFVFLLFFRSLCSYSFGYNFLH